MYFKCNRPSEDDLRFCAVSFSLLGYTLLGLLIASTVNISLDRDLSLGGALLIALAVLMAVMISLDAGGVDNIQQIIMWFPLWLVITPILTVVVLRWYLMTPTKHSGQSSYPLRHR